MDLYIFIYNKIAQDNEPFYWLIKSSYVENNVELIKHMYSSRVGNVLNRLLRHVHKVKIKQISI